MLILIENGDVYAPESLGVNSVLIAFDKIMQIGDVDRRAIESLGVEIDVVDATGCFVTPGLIDPHEHLLGGSGEKGFATQTPEIYPSEIVSAGITTVVGCLGVDTTMKTMAGLLAKAKALKEEGVSAFVWSGGYDVPPSSISDSVRNDIMFIEEVIGAGEIAIADERSTDHVPHELARLVIDTHNGGMLSNKAGITHFHVGNGKERLKSLMNILNEFPVEPDWIYPTHITRSKELMKEAITLAKKGAHVDIDTVNKDLPKWLKFYLDNNGLPEKLTVSTDASITSPQNLIDQIRACVLEHKFPLAQVLALATKNTAEVLKLNKKGLVETGKDADLVLLRKKDLEIKDVFAAGRRLIKNGRLNFKEKFLEQSDRRVRLDGSKE